jgi:hypothetical protein
MPTLAPLIRNAGALDIRPSVNHLQIMVHVSFKNHALFRVCPIAGY